MGGEETEMTPPQRATGRGARKVLVTGGGGFLGSVIVRRLVERGDRVRSLARNFYPALERLGVEQIQGDLSDARVVEKACLGRELVFHTAAKPPPWGRYRNYYRTNVMGTQHIIDGCLKGDVSCLVYTSTPSVVFGGRDLEGVDESVPYPGRFNAFYPRTKALAEQKVVRAAGKRLLTICLRPHQIWGPGDPHFVPRLIARAGRLKRIGDGKNLVDTTYIDNAAAAHLLAADRLAQNPALSGRIYFISQAEPIPAWDMINAILSAAGLQPVTGSVSHRSAWLIGLVLEFFYRTLRIPAEPPMTRFLADAVAKSHWFDISAARRDLGYAPAVSTAEGLRRLADWLQNRQKEGGDQ